MGTTAVATLSPLNVTFAGQYVKNSGSPQTATLMNTGTATLAITNVAVSPADFGMVGTSRPLRKQLSRRFELLDRSLLRPNCNGHQNRDVERHG